MSYQELMKDLKGRIKNADSYKTQLHNGYSLSIDYCRRDPDGSFVSIEYWCTEEMLAEIHKHFARFIKDFGLPRLGDAVLDNTSVNRVAEIWVDYTQEIPEVHLTILEH